MAADPLENALESFSAPIESVISALGQGIADARLPNRPSCGDPAFEIVYPTRGTDVLSGLIPRIYSLV